MKELLSRYENVSFENIFKLIVKLCLELNLPYSYNSEKTEIVISCSNSRMELNSVRKVLTNYKKYLDYSDSGREIFISKYNA